MLRIEKVDESNKQQLINFLKLDVIKHVFAVYDLQHDPNHTVICAALENGNLKGYILTYTALQFPTYGVFIKDELVSYASSFLQLPQVWMMGGVYTHPNHRNKGYATLATSAVTEEALKNADSAALFVRADNYAAIKVYEKIGYRKIGEKLWVDVGTGLKP
ncbi:MAG: GNAT family N-acetyltransferase [Candidatus Bathyarchaeia archaeon]